MVSLVGSRQCRSGWCALRQSRSVTVSCVMSRWGNVRQLRLGRLCHGWLVLGSFRCGEAVEVSRGWACYVAFWYEKVWQLWHGEAMCV